MHNAWLQFPGMKHAVLLGLTYAVIHFSVSRAILSSNVKSCWCLSLELVNIAYMS